MPSRDDALRRDAEDPSWRAEFCIPPFPGGAEPELAYLAGNSLGLQPRTTRAALEVELDRWAEWGVEGQLNGPRPWKDYHEALTEPAARLVGALPHEAVVMNSLTVNLHFMLATFYRPEGRRTKVVMEDIVFPSDGYAIDSQVAWHGLDPSEHVVRLRPREGEDVLRSADVVAAIRELGDEVAAVVFSAVNYRTGEWLDMPAITAAGHDVGATVGWDLAHAAGNVPMRLHDWQVDWAAWCSYKYLNSGPGAVAGVFVHERHARDTSLPRLAGWWGTNTATRFRMERHFDPPPSADAWQVSNPPILAMAPVEQSLRIFDRVGMEALRARSLRLHAFLRGHLEAVLAQRPGAFDLVTPAAPEQHGSQLSVRVRGEADAISAAMRDADGVIADARRPDIIRLSPAPLYCSYLDCWRAADSLARHATA